jgi:ABC-type nitrate/sulfonate/bicarbonate transport system permease component
MLQTDLIERNTGAARVPWLNRDRLAQAAAVIALLIVWEIIGRQIGRLILAPPSAVFSAFLEMVETGEIRTALGDSLGSLLLGFLIALLIGLVAGGLMGWYRPLAQVLDPFISGFYVVPVAALVPLLIVWFGIGTVPRIMTIVLFAVFEITIATTAGVRGVDERLIEMARSFGANTRQLALKVVLPDVLPVIFAGIRIGMGRAVQGMVTAELLFAVTGLGGLVMRYAGVYRLDKVLVTVVIVSLLGVTAMGLIQLIEQRLVRRHH